MQSRLGTARQHPWQEAPLHHPYHPYEITLRYRVMTVSFHMYGNYFFPGTGALEDVGERGGRFCSLNVPLVAGTDNGTFLRMFKRIMRRVMEVYQPECVVLQCGAQPPGLDQLWRLGLGARQVRCAAAWSRAAVEPRLCKLCSTRSCRVWECGAALQECTSQSRKAACGVLLMSGSELSNAGSEGRRPGKNGQKSLEPFLDHACHSCMTSCA